MDRHKKKGAGALGRPQKNGNVSGAAARSAAARRRALAARRRRARALRRRRILALLITVSYTHLTLPTILLV